MGRQAYPYQGFYPCQHLSYTFPAMRLLGLLVLSLGLVAADNLVPYLQTGSGINDYFGLLDLPRSVNFHHPPEGCLNFDSICQLETTGRFAEAFQAYEARLMNCSCVGWDKLGNLGVGHTATVSMKVTPCGMHVGMKGTRGSRAVAHIAHDCLVLKEVNDVPNSVCRKCFPQYYHYSNLTSYCYFESVPSVHMVVFLDHFHANTSEGFKVMRRAFVQGLGALEVLHQANVSHNDLTFGNILVRLPKNGSTDFQVVFIDFGAAYSQRLGRPDARVAIDRFGNRGYPDAMSYACEFLQYYYAVRFELCRSPIPLSISTEVSDAKSFHHVLARMYHMTRQGSPDFRLLRGFARAAEHL